ncbi:MAG: hypothetical protein J5J06_15440 [Phycisphaerae bacterium]|nr:hypothetical protein [Phycisphaerae bacterium]
MYRAPNISGGDLITRALEGAAELRKDFDMLPETDSDGNSECPDAEGMFYRKERTAQFVRDDLDSLKRDLKFTNDQIAERERKVDELAHERDRLHGDQAQDKFAEAELKLLAHIRDLQHRRRDLLDAIAELEATLREAGSRKFPGGDPRGPFGQRVHSEPQVPRPLEEITRGNAQEEVDRIRRMAKDR